MRIATWNVNSIRSRQLHVADWLAQVRPDILLLQEIKCEAHQFPAATYEALGYQAEVVGQKSYNGVAALTRVPVEVSHRTLPGLPVDDVQSRYLELTTSEGVTVIGIYLPNGNSGGEIGYEYKLAWMDRLADRAEALLANDVPLVIAGDFNVCPEDRDYAPGSLPSTDALVRPPTRARFRRMLWAGLTDAVREMHPTTPGYTFWDYQAGAWRKDAGLRIDHALLSPTLAERLVTATPDRAERGREQPSDHVPVMVEII